MTARYLGSGTLPDDVAGLTGPVPAHLPPRLTITLWDFSWYTQAGPADPYENLDAAVADAAALGYNAIRICAAPLLLHGGLGLDSLAHDLEIEGLGVAPDGEIYGRRTRWYDVRGGYSLDLSARLRDLAAACRRHGVVLILASWEYQQSPAFARSSRWFDALDAVPLEERYGVLARAWDPLLVDLTDAGFRAQIALVEIHNEVDFSILPALAGAGAEHVAWLRARHPDLLVTASYGKPPHLAMYRVPPGLGAAQFHVYSYGVLDALQQRIDIRVEGSGGFPGRALRDLLRADAPSPHDYGTPAAWKMAATVVTDQMVYGYDWIDPDAWDDWLEENYPPFHEVMRREIAARVTAVAAWARWQGIPAVIGEGWVGYTPLRGGFEEGAIGVALAEHGIDVSLDQGVWGVVLCSNAAPHHPMWQQREWQRAQNARILAA